MSFDAHSRKLRKDLAISPQSLKFARYDELRAKLEELTRSEGLEPAFEYDFFNEGFLGVLPGIITLRWSN